MKEKVAYFGLFTALALILSYLELLIPFHFGAGIKLGLANLVTVIVLYKCGAREAIFLSMVRVILSGFLFGNMFAIFYGLAGALLSWGAMSLLKRQGSFSVIGVSIAGGVAHNAGQLLVAMAVTQSISVGYYFPVLFISGLITGALIGILSKELLKRLQNFDLSKGSNV